jgi:lysophospholipase L1-like esterase
MIAAYALAVVLAANGFSAFGGSGRRGGGASVTVRPATVAWYGDSRTQGACSSVGPPAVLDSLLPSGYSVQNKGVSGETAHEIYVRVAAGAATACVGEACGHYIVQGGVNTLKHPTFNGQAAGDVASVALNGSVACDTGTPNSCGTLDSVELLHAAHPRARVFVIGEMPYGGCDVLTCPSLEAPGPRAGAYNAALLSACAARPWLTCIFPYDDFEDQDTPDDLLPAYRCADGIHLLDAGSAALAAMVYSSAAW